MIGLLGRQGPAAPLGQHCPQMTRRPGTYTPTLFAISSIIIGEVLQGGNRLLEVVDGIGEIGEELGKSG